MRMTSEIGMTDEQREFVFAPLGSHQSMQSWAGTGKTHTLTERVVRLLTVHGVVPDSIVITTFTVEGARECLKRLNGRMGCESGVRVGTMDSLASQWMWAYFQPTDYYIGIQEYGTMLLDFLRSDEGHKIKSKIKYLIVDEFQDLSKTQLDTVMEFYRAGTSVLAIGDVAQNIYEWRGCHGHFLSSLPQRIPEMLEFRLTENRRCTPEIIAAGNACLRFLRHPPERLMRPVRPSMDVKPIIDTLKPQRSMGAHVLSIIKRYHSTLDYGDIAVIGRYKQGLFNLEENLIKANRFTHAQVPFVTSASVGDIDKSPLRKPGHLTMMTLHQSKGLEWPTVILLLWDPNLLDEEWRLLYVAITRARDNLYIISPSQKTTNAFLERIGDASLFRGPDGSAITQVAVTDKPFQPRKPDKTVGVVDVIRSLSCEHIHEMRRASLIPMTRGIVSASPGCKIKMYKFQKTTEKFAEITDAVESAEADDDVDANGLQIEFGNFVDRFITRLFWSKMSRRDVLIDRDAKTILETVFLSNEHCSICSRYDVKSFLSDQHQTTKVDLLHTLADGGADRNEIRTLCDALDRISLHCRSAGTKLEDVRLSEGRPHMNYNELSRLRTSYDKFTDIENPKVLFHTYRVSLCNVVIKGRKSMWYHPDTYAWFRRKLAFMTPCIRRYVDDVLSHNEELMLKPTFAYHTLVGEADIVAGACVVDYKCSKRTHDFAWLAQGLAYVAMASTQYKLVVDKLHIFNPIMQTIWEYDCGEWSHATRLGFIDYLAALSNSKL